MSPPEQAWRFYCGVCTKPLTDATALFTSCGHFFCADNSSCTRLQPGNAAGTCEQCSNQCDAGTLANRGERYDERVRSFVFRDLEKDLKTIAEIFNFRDKHLTILGDNAASQAARIRNLKAEYTAQLQENASLRSENDTLRAENDAFRAQLAAFKRPPPTEPHPPAPAPQHRPRAPSVEIVDAPTTRIAPSPANKSVRDSLRYDKPRPKPKPRASQDLYKHAASRAQPGGSAADSRAARATKRRWEGRSEASAAKFGRTHRIEPSVAAASRAHRIEPSVAMASRAHRIQPSVAAISRTQRGAPRFTSSRATGLSVLSRFARGAGPTANGTTARVPGSLRREPGDWQRKVSNVPRPSATPDRLGRKPVKRSRHGLNPMARW